MRVSSRSRQVTVESEIVVDGVAEVVTPTVTGRDVPCTTTEAKSGKG